MPPPSPPPPPAAASCPPAPPPPPFGAVSGGGSCSSGAASEMFATRRTGGGASTSSNRSPVRTASRSPARLRRTSGPPSSASDTALRLLKEAEVFKTGGAMSGGCSAGGGNVASASGRSATAAEPFSRVRIASPGVPPPPHVGRGEQFRQSRKSQGGEGDVTEGDPRLQPFEAGDGRSGSSSAGRGPRAVH